MSIHLETTDAPNPDDLKTLLAGLVSYNNSAADLQNRLPLAVFAKDGSKLVGGASGVTQGQWLFLNHLWVDDAHRRFGLGTRLVREIENAAKARGCIGSHLDTFSFQALGFYQRVGYKLYGTIPNYPPGHSRHYLFRQFNDA
jgi:GNAT superfamily N-acetyltransferase